MSVPTQRSVRLQGMWEVGWGRWVDCCRGPELGVEEEEEEEAEEEEEEGDPNSEANTRPTLGLLRMFHAQAPWGN